VAKNTLVFNSAFQPLGVISPEEAICVVVQDKAWVWIEDEDRPYRSQHMSINAPVAIVLNHYVKPDSLQFKAEKLANSNLFRRDNYSCQYCGRHVSELDVWEKLTRDHIIPKDRGGPDIWTNVVTACSTCNHNKSNRTPEEAAIKLRTKPSAPSTWVIRGKNKLSNEQLELAESVLGLRSEGDEYAGVNRLYTQHVGQSTTLGDS
jgi:hypothetical protein